VHRSLAATKLGKELVKKALEKKRWTAEDLSHQLADDSKMSVSRSTAYGFCSGAKIRPESFKSLCGVLDLNWEVIAGLRSEPTAQDFEVIADLGNSPAPDARRAKSELGAVLADHLDEETIRFHCREKILSNYSKITLFNRKQIDVDQIFVEVYLLEEPPKDRFAKIEELLAPLENLPVRERLDRVGLGKRGEQRILGSEMAALAPKLMILGKPGSGKSTFLQRLAILCCRDEFPVESQIRADLIPVLLELRKCQFQQFDLLELVRNELDLGRSELIKILQSGHILLLMDGLDEVPVQFRKQVQDEINQFTRRFYANRFVVTCRTQTAENILAGFEYVEVADFTIEQQQQFIRNWFSVSQGFLARFLNSVGLLGGNGADKLLKIVEENPQVSELASVPVLLSLICWVYTNNKGKLPDTRTDLYKQGLSLLLKTWNDVPDRTGHEQYRQLTVTQKKQLFQKLARIKFENPDNFVLFTQDEVSNLISRDLNVTLEQAEGILCAIEQHHGLLVERAQMIWSFSHLTFQEYFAAQWFIHENAWEGIITIEKITDPRWKEVLRLVVEAEKQIANNFLRSIKLEIDIFVNENNRIQQLLNQLQDEVKSFQKNERNGMRAYYFSLYLDFDYDLALALGLKLACSLDRSDNRKLARDLGLARAFDLARSLASNSDLSRERTCGYNYELAQELSKTSPPLLRRKLNLISRKLPGRGDWDYLDWWWKQEGRAWVDEFYQIMSEYYNNGGSQYIASHIQWNHQDRCKLKQYYDANKLLLELLKSKNSASPRICREIENSLLFPIAELKRRLPNQ
jgi:NACHT domain